MKCLHHGMSYAVIDSLVNIVFYSKLSSQLMDFTEHCWMCQTCCGVSWWDLFSASLLQNVFECVRLSLLNLYLYRNMLSMVHSPVVFCHNDLQEGL